MKQTLGFLAIVTVALIARAGNAAAQAVAEAPASHVEWSPQQVEKAANVAMKTNRLLGSLLNVTTRRIEGRYFYQDGLWWYWMPEGYWAVWDGENWSRFRN